MEENMFSINENDYTQKTDEMLIENIKNDDKMALNCLIKRYNEIVNMKANKFFMIGAEKEDMIQEGMIGLYKAVKSYDTGKQNSFKTFANMCIERQLITAVKNSNRQKHIPLNSSVSLNAAAFDEDEDCETTVMEVLDTKKGSEDPLEIITKREYFDAVEKNMNNNLSDFEKDVLKLYKNGYSYVTIANKLKTKVKSVDTAIQRIKKKAAKIKQQLEAN